MALYGDLAFSPDGRPLAAAGHWHRLWEISTGREIYRLVQTRYPTFAAVAFRSDGEVLITGSQDGAARIWRVSKGRELFISRAHRDYVETVPFQPGGSLSAYGVRNGSIWLWNTGTRLRNWSAQLVPATSLSVQMGSGWCSVVGALLTFGT